jgi:hypothetical protein
MASEADQREWAQFEQMYESLLQTPPADYGQPGVWMRLELAWALLWTLLAKRERSAGDDE